MIFYSQILGKKIEISETRKKEKCELALKMKGREKGKKQARDEQQMIGSNCRIRDLD